MKNEIKSVFDLHITALSLQLLRLCIFLKFFQIDQKIVSALLHDHSRFGVAFLSDVSLNCFDSLAKLHSLPLALSFLHCLFTICFHLVKRCDAKLDDLVGNAHILNFVDDEIFQLLFGEWLFCAYDSAFPMGTFVEIIILHFLFRFYKLRFSFRRNACIAIATTQQSLVFK